ncbi:hypothetical protein [Amycolatopsis vastitatis]|uniref:hypothetical protein n=1 Tax=Amycolatopsis vastitatis TaxID=1905142 RepID=UPI00142D9DB7|nr:hypothetical protein [Amycolatopsis vastitatis]
MIGQDSLGGDADLLFLDALLVLGTRGFGKAGVVLVLVLVARDVEGHALVGADDVDDALPLAFVALSEPFQCVEAGEPVPAARNKAPPTVSPSGIVFGPTDRQAAVQSTILIAAASRPNPPTVNMPTVRHHDHVLPERLMPVQSCAGHEPCHRCED